MLVADTIASKTTFASTKPVAKSKIAPIKGAIQKVWKEIFLILMVGKAKTDTIIPTIDISAITKAQITSANYTLILVKLKN